ncbi:unnamed protein product [Peronospora belbahrii]|uniref:Uncharacterized protein n=1 Tax=Peronospora belbahrii TaxID=622444 RepID=A0AAU9KX79_9STRA|nr:unnamed protein product [Peronospora belbahrii]CAH0519983.1 unnamed protein product [Peronospora belbahrii]
MERALGEPALVLCSVCLNSGEHEGRWLPLRCGDDQALLLYNEKRDIWFILKANKHSVYAHGVERRIKTRSSVSLDVPMRAAKKRSIRNRRLVQRKSGRNIKQHVQREQMLAYEWSLGNLPLKKSKHLWKDNEKRVVMENDPTSNSSSKLATKQLKRKQDRDVKNVNPGPLEVFCVILGCTRFAKTGYCCRFHSSKPLVFDKPNMES